MTAVPIKKSNVVLIGMPGSGKSTIGVLLAKRSSRDFLDTDVVIQSHAHRSLQDIVDNDGYMALREIEEQAILGLVLENCVIATGGSAVYSDKGMTHLGENGTIVFLEVSLETLKERITDYEQRGIAKRPDQSFEELFEERAVLYKRYADIVIQSDRLTQEQACTAILDSL